MAKEGLKKTDNDLIHISCPIPFDTNKFLRQLENLKLKAYANKPDIWDTVWEWWPLTIRRTCPTKRK